MAPTTDRNTVQSVGKAFNVLLAFTRDRSELTMTEAATAAGLDRGTSFRMIQTLVSLGYVAQVPGTRRFWLTLKCLDLGFAALSAGGLRGLSRPLLQNLVPAVADAASLGLLDGADVVYVERMQVDMGRYAPDRRAGSRTGAYAAALGHAILAWLPVEEARRLLLSGDRVARSDRTLTDIDALCARLIEVRSQGYAVSDGENAYGLRTIAAPVFWPDGSVRAALSATVRAERQTLATFVAAAVPPLLRAATALTDAVRMTGQAE